MKRAGHEKKRIKLGEVGRAMIPYQQSLHRQFFGCNAVLAYRGSKEERIYSKINKTKLDSNVRKLHSYLNGMSNKHGYIYRQIKHLRNIPRRLMYNSMLYFLHYIYITDKQLFSSHEHLKYSLVTMVLISIENTYLRTNDGSRNTLHFIHQQRESYSVAFYTETYSVLESICQSTLEDMEFKSKKGSKNGSENI